MFNVCDFVYGLPFFKIVILVHEMAFGVKVRTNLWTVLLSVEHKQKIVVGSF
jgi:hypothetical protein